MMGSVMTFAANADDSLELFGGRDLLPWMLLAFGGAMVVGNVLALVRPPRDAPRRGGTPTEAGRPPAGRALALIAVGGVCALWAALTLLR